MQVAERLHHHGQQCLAFIRQRQAARQAPEQRFAQPVFQLADVLAHGGLGHVQLLGGARQVQVAGRGLEGTQGVERQVHGAKRSKFFLGLLAIIDTARIYLNRSR